jgi:hypothetical protein
MWLHRCNIKPTSPLLVGIALAAAASVAAAQGNSRPLFQWNGRVDREVQLTMRGGQIWTKAYSQSDDHLPGPEITNSLPRDDGIVRVRLERGQAEVRVIQQPHSRRWQQRRDESDQRVLVAV